MLQIFIDINYIFRIVSMRNGKTSAEENCDTSNGDTTLWMIIAEISRSDG